MHCRRGFTLIELLVVVTILLILTFTTVAVLNTTFDSDRIRSSSRQVQSALLGARDRALRAGRNDSMESGQSPIRGLRFILDPNSAPGAPMVTSMVYVRQLPEHLDGQIAIGREDHDLDGIASNSGGTAPPTIVVRGYNTGWKRLYDAGLLVNGARIEIPHTGAHAYYTVDASLLATYAGNGPEVLVLTSTYNGPEPIALGSAPAPEGPDGQPGFDMVDDDNNGTVDDGWEYGWPGSDDVTDIHAAPPFPLNDYRLSLSAAVESGQEPMRLSSGICIDLAHSTTIPTTILTVGYFDVLYSPRGTIVGPLAAQGMMNLLLTQITDAARGIPGDAPFWTGSTAVMVGTWCVPSTRNGFMYRCSVAGTTAGAEPTWPTTSGGTVVDSGATWEAFDFGERLLVTLRTQTGHVTTHPVYLHGPAEPTDPFRYARRGEVAGR